MINNNATQPTVDTDIEPWDRQRDPDGELEPNRWYSRFSLDFQLLGPDRSLLGAYRRWLKRIGKVRKGQGEPQSAPPSWRKAAVRWRWFERAEAWDKVQMDRLREEEAEKWIERQLQAREQEWEAAQALWQRIEEMMRFPLATVSRPNEEGGTTVITPTKWSHRDIATFMRTASELARQATELETSRSKLEIDLSVKDYLDALPPELRTQVRRHLVEALQRRADQGDD